MQELHEALAGGGGGATFIVDNGYCYGRTEEVLPAIRRFADRLTALGLHLQFQKCSFYSPRTLPSAVRAELDALGISPGGMMRTPEGDEASQTEVCITQPFLPGITVGGVPLASLMRRCFIPCSGCVVVSPASVALAWRPLHARRAVLHDLDAALSGRLRRGRCACCPPPPLASRAHRGLWPLRRPLRICRARLHFADRLRAGAGRRSGSGWRQGRIRWGRTLLSRPAGSGRLRACGC